MTKNKNSAAVPTIQPSRSHFIRIALCTMWRVRGCCHVTRPALPLVVRHHSLGSLRTSSTVVEIKRKLDGREQRFELEHLGEAHDDGNERVRTLVGVWHAGAHGAFGLPAFSYSYGVWHDMSPLTVYRLHLPDGSLLRYRCDAIGSLHLSARQVLFTDLLLDALVVPPPQHTRALPRVELEDEDEVAAATSSGMLTPHLARRVARIRALLLNPTYVQRLIARTDAAIDAAVRQSLSLLS